MLYINYLLADISMTLFANGDPELPLQSLITPSGIIKRKSQ